MTNFLSNLPCGHPFVMGIDGCRAGWIAIALTGRNFAHTLVETRPELLELLAAAEQTFIDIPIGLSDCEASRTCDRLLRTALSPHFSSSVFNPPVRQAVYAHSYEDACQKNAAATGKKISKQSWNISAKIRQIDELLLAHSSLRHTVLESHPEFLFFNLNGGHLIHKKKTVDGKMERLRILSEYFPSIEDVFDGMRSHYLKKQLADDDIVDALALTVCSHFARKRGLNSLPQPTERDKHGIPMAIHYVLA